VLLLCMACSFVFVGCRKSEQTSNETPKEKASNEPGSNQESVRWRVEKKSTVLRIGPHTVPIPDGWRDLSELDAATGTVAPGMASMTPEKQEAGAMRTTIVLGWAALTPGKIDPRNPPCAEIAALVGKRFQATVSDVATIEIDGDAGCSWTAVSNELRIVQRVRFQGDHQLVAQWTRTKALGESAGDDARVWRDVLVGLHFPK